MNARKTSGNFGTKVKFGNFVDQYASGTLGKEIIKMRETNILLFFIFAALMFLCLYAAWILDVLGGIPK